MLGILFLFLMLMRILLAYHSLSMTMVLVWNKIFLIMWNKNSSILIIENAYQELILIRSNAFLASKNDHVVFSHLLIEHLYRFSNIEPHMHLFQSWNPGAEDYFHVLLNWSYINFCKIFSYFPVSCCLESLESIFH